jgi:hypothetical protein
LPHLACGIAGLRFGDHRHRHVHANSFDAPHCTAQARRGGTGPLAIRSPGAQRQRSGAVVESLNGLVAKKQISPRQLADYVITRVGNLAEAQRKSQGPQYFKGETPRIICCRGGDHVRRLRQLVGTFEATSQTLHSTYGVNLAVSAPTPVTCP